MPAKSPDYSHDYNLLTLKANRDPSAQHADFSETDQTTVDIGCGTGQSWIAADLGRDRTLIGIDANEEGLGFGRSLSDRIQFINTSAEAIPLASASCDLVFSRVALPYTDDPRSRSKLHACSYLAVGA